MENKEWRKKEGLVRSFCKHFSLPIHIYKEPYFSYFFNLYDNTFDLSTKEGWLNELLSSSNGRDKEVMLSVTEKVVKDIKETTAYKQMLGFCYHKKNHKIPKLPIIYGPNYLNKNLFSIDIIKANYSALVMFGIQDELNINSYEDLLEKHTDFKYILNSKLFRQYLFSELKPVKQVLVQNYIIDRVIEALEGLTPVAISSDELIVTGAVNIKEIRDSLRENLPNEINNLLRVEKFVINKIANTSFCLKEVEQENGVVLSEIKNTDKVFYAQVFKYLHNMDLEKEDLMFTHNDMIAFYESPKLDFKLKSNKKLKI